MTADDAIAVNVGFKQSVIDVDNYYDHGRCFNEDLYWDLGPLLFLIYTNGICNVVKRKQDAVLSQEEPRDAAVNFDTY